MTLADLYDMTTALGIDEVVRDRMSTKSPKIRQIDPLPDELACYFYGNYYRGSSAPEIPAVMVARRGLMCALEYSIAAPAMGPNEVEIQDWERLAKDAGKTAELLKRVLTNLANARDWPQSEDQQWSAAQRLMHLWERKDIDLANWLERQGVDWCDAENLIGPLRTHPVVFRKQGFEFADRGPASVIQAVYDKDGSPFRT